MKRRTFLKVATVAMATPGMSAQVMASPAAGSERFLVVLLRGACDAASVLVPYSSDFYHSARPTIAIDSSDASLRLNADWMLHPALKGSLAPILSAGQMRFIPFMGIPGVTRSHFEAQDRFELGVSGKDPADKRSGMLYRLADALDGSRPIAFTVDQPLIFRGPDPVPNISLRSIPAGTLSDAQRKSLEAMYRGHTLSPSLEKGLSLENTVRNEMADANHAASRSPTAAPGTFEGDAQQIARLMSNDFNLGFIDVGGWDTHTAQGNVQGALARKLEQLGNGLAAFIQAMGDGWRNTTVVVASEFGRTFKENGSRGTDHGYGTTYWAMGGWMKGAPVAGEQVTLRPETLFEGRDLPILTDYRSLFAEIAEKRFGLSRKEAKAVFGVDARSLLS